MTHSTSIIYSYYLRKVLHPILPPLLSLVDVTLRLLCTIINNTEVNNSILASDNVVLRSCTGYNYKRISLETCSGLITEKYK